MEFSLDCKHCGCNLWVPNGDPSDYRECPTCSGTSLHVTGWVRETVNIQATLDTCIQERDPDLSKTQAKRNGIDIKCGMDWWRDGHKHVFRYQEVNRPTDRYVKVVVDLESGIPLRYCNEPLSEHKKPAK